MLIPVVLGTTGGSVDMCHSECGVSLRTSYLCLRSHLLVGGVTSASLPAGISPSRGPGTTMQFCGHGKYGWRSDSQNATRISDTENIERQLRPAWVRVEKSVFQDDRIQDDLHSLRGEISGVFLATNPMTPKEINVDHDDITRKLYSSIRKRSGDRSANLHRHVHFTSARSFAGL